MPLDIGTPAPEVDLPVGAPGEAALLAFFKMSCPTCMLSFPVWGELARRYGDAVAVVAVSQDPLPGAREWLDDHGFPGPVLDDSGAYPVSDAYDVRTVPTLVLVGSDGRGAALSEGWSRDEANEWAVRLGDLAGRDTAPVSTTGDGLPPFKPG